MVVCTSQLAQVSGGGEIVEAVTSLFPKNMGFGVYTMLDRAAFSNFPTPEIVFENVRFQ